MGAFCLTAPLGYMSMPIGARHASPLQVHVSKPVGEGFDLQAQAPGPLNISTPLQVQVCKGDRR